MNWLVVIAGAMVGAPLRYLTDVAVRRRTDALFPWGTFCVNTAGCLLLGALTGAVLAGAVPVLAQAALGAGLCGALTTYSTFSFQTLRLYEQGAWLIAAANVTASVTCGVGALFLGRLLGGAGWG